MSQICPALAPQIIINASTPIHNHENSVARCDSPKQHPTATAPVDLHGDIVSDRKQREFPAFINQLPNEVLCWIFYLVHVDGWITRTALRMGAVCRLWRHIVTNTGSFWTDVHSGQVDLARLGVERSHEASLKFNLTESLSPMHSEYHLHAHGSRIFPETAVNLLISSIGRVRKLVVKLHPETYSDLLLRLTPFIAPRLTALYLEEISEQGFIVYHTAQASSHVAQSLTSRRLLNAPSLTKLSVQIDRLRGELTIYPNINTLILQLGTDSLHDSSFILGTMRAHARLTNFRLAFEGPLYMREHDTNVRLPCLQGLLLRVGELEDAGYLLCRMEIPEVSLVELDLGTRYLTAPATTASRLQTVISFLPSTFREIPMTVAFRQMKFALIILLMKHPWSVPILAVRLRWEGSVNLELIRRCVRSFIPIFPRLCTASCGKDYWAVGRHIVEE